MTIEVLDNATREFEFTRSQIHLAYGDMGIDPEFPSMPYPLEETISAADDSGDRLN